MKKLVFIISIALGLLLSAGCDIAFKHKHDKGALLEVAGEYLYKSDLEQIIPSNISPEDSTTIADRFIRQWAIDILMYEKAQRNIANTKEIESLVEDYRKSLLVHEYEQQLINQRMEPVPEEEMQDFYEKYTSEFPMQEDIMKGILLVVPQDAPQLKEVRTWLADSDNTESLEKIEKYILQYATGYDFFLDRWVSLGQIARHIPAANLPRTIQTGLIEQADSARLYLLKVEEIRHKGDNMPYEYAKPEIENILRNRKKIEFLQSFEDELYVDALNRGRINFLEQEDNQN